MNDNPYLYADKVAKKRVEQAASFIATVVAVDGGLISFRRAGSSTTEGPHPAAAGLAATLCGGELVLVVQTGSTLVVLQEIVTS